MYSIYRFRFNDTSTFLRPACLITATSEQSKVRLLEHILYNPRITFQTFNEMFNQSRRVFDVSTEESQDSTSGEREAPLENLDTMSGMLCRKQSLLCIFLQPCHCDSEPLTWEMYALGLAYLIHNSDIIWVNGSQDQWDVHFVFYTLQLRGINK